MHMPMTPVVHCNVFNLFLRRLKTGRGTREVGARACYEDDGRDGMNRQARDCPGRKQRDRGQSTSRDMARWCGREKHLWEDRPKHPRPPFKMCQWWETVERSWAPSRTGRESHASALPRVACSSSMRLAS